MIALFNRPWAAVPTVWIDVETTGVVPGLDAAVEVALVRFEQQRPAAAFASRVNPGRPIPAEATAIHGITDQDVADAPTIADVFALAEVQALLAGAQPGAYNAAFDRAFIPAAALGPDEGWRWPWFDALSLVRVVDRFVKGAGRHKLGAACERRGIQIAQAHSASDDANAAGRLFYALAGSFDARTVGELIHVQRVDEAHEWFRFNDWLSRQPPRDPPV